VPWVISFLRKNKRSFILQVTGIASVDLVKPKPLSYCTKYTWTYPQSPSLCGPATGSEARDVAGAATGATCCHAGTRICCVWFDQVCCEAEKVS